MNNLEIYHKLAEPPASALKQIGGGRLKGMTDINPQWRYKAMTEVFGQCGIGWKYTVDKLWLEPVNDGQVCAFASISLYVLKSGIENPFWSDPIPGTGGSMFIAKERDGLHASDEAYKMAITDALSVAMKMLGVGGAIYEGRWDGSKYNQESNQTANGVPKRPDNSRPPETRLREGSSQGAAPVSEQPPLPWEDNPPTTGAVNQELKPRISKIGKPKFDAMVALLKQQKISPVLWKNYLKAFGYSRIDDITEEKYQEIFDTITKTPEKITGEKK
jgi:hypothetical protein